ncbi:hypothetical protein CL622_07135, partial [archaeon]|nr:hypothetical protein [archaeon]
MTIKIYEESGWEGCIESIMKGGKSKNPNFKKWLLQKDMGNYLFDAGLHLKTFNIQKSINNDDRDHFIVVCGKEGTGKSTLALQIACMLDPTFNLDRVCFKMIDFIKGMKETKPGQTFILDEGNLFLFSREAMSEDNKFMLKLFALMRQKNLCVIICVPNFFTLDSYIRDHRVDSLLYCHSKSKYIGYTGKAIKIISNQGSRYKQVAGHKIPGGSFWVGYWNKFIPNYNDITEKSYRQHKGDHFAEFLDEMESSVQNRNVRGGKWLTMKQTKNLLPLSEKNIRRLGEKGTIP